MQPHLSKKSWKALDIQKVMKNSETFQIFKGNIQMRVGWNEFSDDFK